MYKPVKVHVPQKVHDKLKSLIAQDKGIPIKVDLQEGEDILLLTPGQIIKMRNAKNEGKKSIILRFSRKQVRANVQHEGGFLSAIMSIASKVLPTLLTGLASGLISGVAEKAITKGSGLFLGKRGRRVSEVHLVEAGGLYLSPLFYPKGEGDYHGPWFHPPLFFKGGRLEFSNVKKGGRLLNLKIKGGSSFNGGISSKAILP